MKTRLIVLLFALLLWPVLVCSQQPVPAGENSDSGFFNRTGSDLLFSSDHSTARFYTINGYRFTPFVSAGLGIGYVPYNDPLGLIPIFTDLTVIFQDGDVSPYMFFRMGYTRSIKSDSDVVMDNHNGGLIVNPGLGLQFKTSRSWGFYLNVGYNRDRSAHQFDSWGGRTVENSHTYQRINLGMGFVF
ncbi:hypothetical protein DYD21_16715 [Rhodohalobacter sp. SW132]|uniref:hypothetical protein n=1 Tax=Rhodohalobacter sp. SW132 TaxID=2293433 RepID=UPI000E250026|nr:hypothetical protein [Rhodohalobacter sp. SW132]REL24803.1 hypothetical protein DYD21_16715 [Rhodohalobacter sp. SW132]